MAKMLENRYDFVFYFDVENGNPNGDPDAGNLPRTDPETGYGFTTDVSLKRKIRNYVQMKYGESEGVTGQKGFNIYVKERAVLTLQQERAYTALGLKDKGESEAEETDKAGKKSPIAQAKEWMCEQFYDIRTFGAVMSLKKFNAGQVRGPVQLTFATSQEVVVPNEISITRMAVATEEEAKKQQGDNRTIGKKAYIPYGLYRTEGFVSAPLANQTGFDEEDLELLWESIINMYEHDRSASRGKMAMRKLIVFKHDSKMGNAPAQMLFDLVQAHRATSEDNPARSFNDYQITLAKEQLPAGVQMIEKL